MAKQPPKDRPWADWKKEEWASKAARKMRVSDGQDDDRDWKGEQQKYLADPITYMDDSKAIIDSYREMIDGEIAAGDCTHAAQHPNPQVHQLQRVVDAMVEASGQFDAPVTLLVHKYDISFPPAISSKIFAPDCISIDTDSMNYFLEHPDVFKVVMAHELGHVANKNFTHEYQGEWRRKPLNQSSEILANRLGAIIHGNPKEYARINTEFLLSTTPEAERHQYTEQYPSPNDTAVMMHKWADILDREGAIDGKGHIILDKALPIYQRSKAMTEDLLKIDLATRSR